MADVQRSFDAVIFDDDWAPPRRKQFVGRASLVEPMIKQYRRLDALMADKQLRFACVVADIRYMILAYCFPWQIHCHRGKIAYDLWHSGRAIWTNCTRQAVCIQKTRRLIAGRYKAAFVVRTRLDNDLDDTLRLLHKDCPVNTTQRILGNKTQLIMCYNDLQGICDNPDIRHKNAVRTVARADRDIQLKNKGVKLHQGQHYMHISHLHFASDIGYTYQRWTLDCRHVFLGLLARGVVLARMLDQGTAIEVYEWANGRLTNVWRFKMPNFNYCVVSDYGIAVVYESQVVIINQTRREWG